MKKTIVSRKGLIRKGELEKSKLFGFLIERESMEKLLQYIYTFPEREMSLSDLSKETGVSKSTISRLIRILQEEEIIKVIHLNTIFRVKANLNEFAYLKRKIAYNLSMIYESGLIEWMLAWANDRGLHPKAVVVFGSFRNGDDISTSDIDLAVEVSDDAGPQDFELVDKYGKAIALLGRKIQLHLFNRRNVDINLFNNIANGILLYGFLEVKP
ncbi:nucleotidyltransferase domain-containing protein [Candidatus Woesearchaeota archaeon]|nr:nucleotidyltransferase domain-containing protein [Candidatus Woesearchaeota archaeon]